MVDGAQNSDSTRIGTPPAAVDFSTRELGTYETRRSWTATIQQLYCELDVVVHEPRRRFEADLQVRPIGEIQVSTIRADPHTVVRTRSMIDAADHDDFLLCLVTDGFAELTQAGRTALLEPGSFAILDCAAPFSHSSPTPFEQVVLRVGREQLSTRLEHDVAATVTARAVPDLGSGRVVSHFLRDIATVEGDPRAGSAFALSSSALDLVAAVLTESGPPTPSRTRAAHARDLQTVQRALLGYLDDSERTVGQVASEMGMSLRYVQKLFQLHGTTPRAWLFRARVERARQYLLSTDATVAAISDQVGFRDVSHFSRLFRDVTGSSPGEFRRSSRAAEMPIADANGCTAHG